MTSRQWLGLQVVIYLVTVVAVVQLAPKRPWTAFAGAAVLFLVSERINAARTRAHYKERGE